MNIAIFEHALSRVKGGMEKVAIDVANFMQQRGHNVLLISDNKDSQAGSVYDTEPGIKVVNIDVVCGDITDEVLSILKNFNTNVFLFVFASVNYLPAFYNVFRHCNIPIIFSEHSVPECLYPTHDKLIFRNAILSLGSVIHLLQDEFSNSIPDNLRERVVVIGNPIVHASEPINRNIRATSKKLLYVGRINNDPKQINLLIDAFSMLASEFPQWKLELWGHGPHEDLVQKQIGDYGLEGRIILCGTSDTISKVYASADLFCLPSRLEGFGLVVAEAHAHGIPAVGFADCPGVNTLIVAGENGLLAERMNAKSLSKALERLMADDALREKMGRNAIESIKRFSPETIFGQWERLLQNAVSVGDDRLIKEIDHTIVIKENFEQLRREMPFNAYPGRLSAFSNINAIDQKEMRSLSIRLKREENLNLMLSSQIEQIHNSLSWRVTAILRRIYRK